MTDAVDYLVKAIGGGGYVRVMAIRGTQTVEEARRRHGTAPTATAALGRVLCATALLTATLQTGQRVTIRVLGSGPLGAVIGDGQAGNGVRGYVQNPDVHLPLRPDGKLDVGSAVGLPGHLYVTMDLGLREPYTGTAPLVSGEIGEDLTAYLARSEQTPSLVSLGVLLDRDGTVIASGGLLLQLLPGAGDELAEMIHKNASAVAGISLKIESGLLPEDLIGLIMGDIDFTIVEKQPIRFTCLCSRQRARQLLASLGPTELKDILETDEQAELTCHFCGTQYRFNRQEIKEILAEIDDYDTR